MTDPTNSRSAANSPADDVLAGLLGEAVDLIDELTAIIEDVAPNRLNQDIGQRGANLMERIGAVIE
jgi:hypothetical protein